MDNRKWLKRKYPKTFDEVNKFLNEPQLSDFKKRKYKLGRLRNNVIQVQNYEAGQLIMFKRSNPINDLNYPLHYGIVKCEVGFTESGYHSIELFEQNFIEITE